MSLCIDCKRNIHPIEALVVRTWTGMDVCYFCKRDFDIKEHIKELELESRLMKRQIEKKVIE
jgi:hypothetical protein